jgi:hypothetical protein
MHSVYGVLRTPRVATFSFRLTRMARGRAGLLLVLAALCRLCYGWQCSGAQVLRSGRTPWPAASGASAAARPGAPRPRGDLGERLPLVSRRAGGAARWTASASLGSAADAFRQGLLKTQVAQRFPGEAEEAACAIESWSTRMAPHLFSRVCKGPRLLKEVQEALPMLHWAKVHLASLPNHTGRITLVDLCSGFGYLSMLLAEALPQDRLDKILLVDRAWPLASEPPRDHHISAHHLHADIGWRVPLIPVRCNINKKSERGKLDAIFSSAPGPVFIFGVHLCGALSIRAVELFNAHPQATFFALKPCCLPNKSLAWGGLAGPGWVGGGAGEGEGEEAGTTKQKRGLGGAQQEAETWRLGGYAFPLGAVVARGRHKAVGALGYSCFVCSGFVQWLYIMALFSCLIYGGFM